MGGAVSSGRDNNELIDNLMSGNYIRTKRVAKVFRALDRADYMTPESRDQAYKDLAWRNGPLHLSSPCIYSEVMEGLELRPGLSFLNIGSGTGYLSTLAGLILGTAGISHGVEVHPTIVEYATKKLSQFIENSPSLDDFDFCEPKYYTGNGLCIAPLQCGYDRVYCGAGCPEEYENYFKNLIKVGGILVLPINDTLQQVKRVSEKKWVMRVLLTVSFATLRLPTQDDALDNVKLIELAPPRLQWLARARVRASMREGVIRRNPELKRFFFYKERPWRRPPRLPCPRKICIPIEPGSDVQNLDVLHDLDTESGANEMNALLSLVISMGQNSVAGALRFDRVARRFNESDDSDAHTGQSRNSDDDVSSDDDEDDSDGNDGTDNTVKNSPKAKTDKVVNSDDTINGEDDETQENERTKPQNNSKTDQETEDNNKSDKTADNEKDSNNHNKSVDNGKEENSFDKETESQSDEKKGQSDLFDYFNKLKNKKYSGKRAKKMGKLYRKYNRTSSSDSVDDETPSTSKDCDKDKPKEIPRSKTPVHDDSSGDDDDDKPDSSNPGIPSEVEIFIPKMQEPGTSAEMDWKDSRSKTREGEQNEGSQEEISKSKAKRQKLDSGIGENTPSSSPKSKTEECEGSDSDDSDNWETQSDSDPPISRRRRSGRPSLEEVIERAEAQRLRRRRRNIARGGDARRVRLSLLMKRAIRELPLPQPLKKFVNWGRCYEF